MLPVVLAVGAINCVVAQVLYLPAAKIFAGKAPSAVKGES
jgi:hypothetical protein